MKDNFNEEYNDGYEDDDEFDDSDEFKKIPIDEYEDLIYENEELREENSSLLRMEINEKLINDSIIICSNTWFWSWKSIDYKIQKIKEVYLELKELSEDENEISIDIT